MWHSSKYEHDPLRSHFDECQKNENYLLYLHFCLYIVFYIIYEVFDENVIK